jgi:putative lipase involved disintegration of autophagic bodies
MAALRPDNASIQAHRGFLNGAEALSGKVKQQIRKNLKDFNSILFTGHSAGGAVAALLYAHVSTNGVDSRKFCSFLSRPKCSEIQ